MADSQTFTLQLKAFADKAKNNAVFVIRKTELDLGTDVVLTTPVGDRKLWKVNQGKTGNLQPKGYVGGRLRANWNPSFGAPDTTTTEAIDPSGGSTIATLEAAVAQSDGTKDFYYTNSLPYAIRIEYGHSGQAPKGMVRIAVTNAQTYVDAAVAELPK